MKMKYVDIAVTIVFIVALVVIYFFWGCKWDLVITLIAAAVVIVAGVIAYKQHKKIKDLNAEEEQQK